MNLNPIEMDVIAEGVTLDSGWITEADSYDSIRKTEGANLLIRRSASILATTPGAGVVIFKYESERAAEVVRNRAVIEARKAGIEVVEVIEPKMTRMY